MLSLRGATRKLTQNDGWCDAESIFSDLSRIIALISSGGMRRVVFCKCFLTSAAEPERNMDFILEISVDSTSVSELR